jgi:hypothetical protein
MRTFLKANSSELVIYAIIWLFILAEPVFISMDGSVSVSSHFLRDWLRDIPIFIFFMVNTIWLVPKLLFNKKIGYYIGLVLLLSILSAFAGDFVFSLTHFRPPMKPDMSPYFPGPSMHEFMPPPKKIFGFGFFDQIIISLLIISLNTAIKVTIKWYTDEQIRREVEKEHLKSELYYLQNQISPHFFMNTLNNIHAMIDINGKDAQQAIVKLSKMMRYLLYGSNDDLTSLQKEIEFLESYIDLIRIRIDETVSISLSIPQQYKSVKLPPMLLIPFIENAFKHGVSYKEKSFIHISLTQEGNSLIMLCSNSIISNNKSTMESGIGLKNVKKRLNLLYNDTYHLNINDTGSEFHVKLTIPIYED